MISGEPEKGAGEGHPFLERCPTIKGLMLKGIEAKKGQGGITFYILGFRELREMKMSKTRENRRNREMYRAQNEVYSENGKVMPLCPLFITQEGSSK